MSCSVLGAVVRADRRLLTSQTGGPTKSIQRFDESVSTNYSYKLKYSSYVSQFAKTFEGYYLPTNAPSCIREQVLPEVLNNLMMSNMLIR